MEVEANTSRLKGPLGVGLWLADRCNLSCRYCYAMPFRGTLMQTDRMLSLVDEIAELEAFDVTLSGGEPLLHPEWSRVLSKLLDRGLNVSLLTNGTLLDGHVIDDLNDVTEDRRNRFVLQVSVDGISPDTNDRSRGQGGIVFRNLNVLCKTTDITIQLATVLTAYNVHEIPALIERYYPRIKRFHILDLQRTDRSALAPDLFLSCDRNRRFWIELGDLIPTLPPDILLTNLEIMRRLYGLEGIHDKHRATFSCTSCSAGWTRVEITARFDVLGCDIAKDYTLMGNVRLSSLSDVWRSVGAEHVRKYPFPPCYLIPDCNGVRLVDGLAPEVRGYRSGNPSKMA